ncbi:hypothetical protein SAMN05421868_1741, partial [Paenibacillus naphthalenovorans]
MSEPLIPGGCILLARKIIESAIWEKPPLYLKVWVYLLTKAQHSEYKGLQRGYLRTSIPDIIDGCKWKVGARTEKPTKDQIYQILEWLRKPNEGGHGSNAKATMITTTKATHGLLIGIDNYGFYQDFRNYESNDEGNDENLTEPARKQRQPDNINKNVNNDKNDNKDLSTEILNFRTRYPSDLLAVVDQYLEFISRTRKSNRISDSVVLKIYEYLSKFSYNRIEYALRTHMSNPKY